MDNDNTQIVIDDEDVSDVPALPVAKEGETIDWEAQAKTYQGMATRRGTKLSKLKTAVKPPDNEVVEPPAPKTGDLGYAEKAYLNSLGFIEADDHAYVQSAMKDTGKSLEDVMKSPFITGELKQRGEERKTKAAAPTGDDRSNPPARDTVEYWIQKGELPPADQVELRRKVVNAKMNKQKGGNHFAQNSVVGSA